MTVAFSILTLVSAAIALWQWRCGRRFPLHQRLEKPSPALPVTVFKPLKGWDAETETAIQSWLSQEYSAPVELLFGTDRADEAAREGVQRLLKRFPQPAAQVILCDPHPGPHPKLAKLAQMYPRASSDILVVSDADVSVPPDFLAHTVPWLSEPAVGLVNCFYRQAPGATLAMRWLAIAINADFWTQVLQSNSLKPQDFALGAVMMVRRNDLETIGGFCSFIDYLADDYQLGHRITRLGRRIQLSPLVVDCRSADMGWGQVWGHQLRQARTIRSCHPFLYFFSIFNNVTVWCLLWLVFSPSVFAAGGVATAQAIRIFTALQNETRIGRRSPAPRRAWMIPIKDLLQFAVWVGAFLGNEIQWRGERFRLRPGGRLERCQSNTAEPAR